MTPTQRPATPEEMQAAKEALRESTAAIAAASAQSVTAEWLASMIRNYVEEDDFVGENGAVVVQTPGDPLTILVFQKGGDHLMIQVNRAEVVVS